MSGIAQKAGLVVLGIVVGAGVMWLLGGRYHSATERGRVLVTDRFTGKVAAYDNSGALIKPPVPDVDLSPDDLQRVTLVDAKCKPGTPAFLTGEASNSSSFELQGLTLKCTWDGTDIVREAQVYYTAKPGYSDDFIAEISGLPDSLSTEIHQFTCKIVGARGHALPAP